MAPPPTRHERLAELLRALRADGPRRAELSAAVSGELWGRCLQPHVEALPFRERFHVRRAWHLAQAGLLAARRGELASARQSLGEAFTSRRGLPERQGAAAFCQSVSSAAEAYLLYREGKYKDAREALRLSNEADLVLLSLGVTAAHLHRAQLVHNLVRLEARCGAFSLAEDLADRLTDHLQGASTELPMAGPWEPQMVDACPIELVAAMIYQVASERGRLAA
jgi:hypothetical protein